MEAKEYQNLAMRTNDGKGTERLEKWIGEETAGSRTHEERNWRCLLVYRGYLPFDGLRPGRDLPDEY